MDRGGKGAIGIPRTLSSGVFFGGQRDGHIQYKSLERWLQVISDVVR